MQTDRYPWDVELHEREWQCVYCGRFMDDDKAVRRAPEKGYKLDMCVACSNALRSARLSTLEGRQKRIEKVLKIEHATLEGMRVYVNREGVGEVKVRKGMQMVAPKQRFERDGEPPAELPDPWFGLLKEDHPGPDPDPLWKRVLEGRER